MACVARERFEQDTNVAEQHGIEVLGAADQQAQRRGHGAEVCHNGGGFEQPPEKISRPVLLPEGIRGNVVHAVSVGDETISRARFSTSGQCRKSWPAPLASSPTVHRSSIPARARRRRAAGNSG
jgi:hypothetical protein